VNPWILLGFSIVTEVAGTTALKLSDGFSKPPYIALVAICYGVSFYVFSLALKHIHLGVAYAIWAGLGTASIALIGMAFFGETLTMLKVLSMSAIVIGVVGLNIASGAAA
jgi:small multidrug resistance pump